MQNENYEEAIAIFQRLLPEYSHSSRIYPPLVKCYMDLEKLQEAKDTCLEWLKQCSKLSGFEMSEM